MKKLSLSTLSLLACLAVPSSVFAAPKMVDVAIENAKGEKVGHATLTDVKGGVKINLRVTGLPPGKHGIHFHETGVCTAPDFKSAGAHFNPAHKTHGLNAKAQSPHAGDLPNLEVAEDGTGQMEMVSKRISLKDGRNSLLKTGTSLVIHAKPDDQKTDPSGDSGDRIACGTIKK